MFLLRDQIHSKFKRNDPNLDVNPTPGPSKFAIRSARFSVRIRLLESVGVWYNQREDILLVKTSGRDGFRHW